MSDSMRRLIPNLISLSLSGKAKPRAFAAAFKVCGRRLERGWPFIPSAEASDLNLNFTDLLTLQWTRSRNFKALIVGAFDGIANDPTSDFIRAHDCRAVFVEPQPGPFHRLRASTQANTNVELINVAVDKVSGSRDFFNVPTGIAGLPAWTEQLASFDRNHIIKHEDRAPGVSQHIITSKVQTLSFNDLLDQCALDKLDLLQIDAEGMDSQLLAWFPFDRMKPALLYYETIHMSANDHSNVSRQLNSMGYRIFKSESLTDDMAIHF